MGEKYNLNSLPYFAHSGEGVRIACLSFDSPTAKVELQKGNTIIKLS